MSAPRGAPNREARAATLAEARERVIVWTQANIRPLTKRHTESITRLVDALVAAAQREERETALDEIAFSLRDPVTLDEVREIRAGIAKELNALRAARIRARGRE